MERLLRVKDIVGDKSNGIAPIIPISKSAWWAGVAEGKFPTPIKLGARTTCWRETEVMALMRAH